MRFLGAADFVDTKFLIECLGHRRFSVDQWILGVPSDDAMVFDQDERWMAVDHGQAKEGIESQLQWPGFQFRVPIGWSLGPESEMPFANTRGRVTSLPSDIGDRGSLGVHHKRRAQEYWAPEILVASRVATREQGVTRWRTNGRRRMRVGKPSALARESVDVRSPNLGGAITTEVAITHIVGENNHDIRRVGLREHRRRLGVAERENRHDANQLATKMANHDFISCSIQDKSIRNLKA